MGPKKGKGKGGPVDGVDTTSMSREQLEAFSLRLREELDREREERNFFQLERDKLRTFWEITRQQLEETRAHLRNQDRIQDENEENHQSEIKAAKQKVKHLLYEHQCSLSDLKVEGVVALKMAQDEYMGMESELLKDKNSLKARLKEQELAHQEVVRELKMEHSAEVSMLREQFSQDAAELEKKYEARLGTQYEEQGLRHSMELGEVEQRKNRQVVELTKSHEQAFNDMKNYYNDITLNNLALISSLKEQMEELRNGHERMEKQLREVQGENKRLSEPLKQARTELLNLQRQLASYEQDKITLSNTKQRLALVTKELEDLRWENEVLELRFDKVEKERNRLHQEFVGAVLDVQQKTGLKSAMLEKKMADLRGGAVSYAPRLSRWRPYRPAKRRSRLRKQTATSSPYSAQLWSTPEHSKKSDNRNSVIRFPFPISKCVKPSPSSSDLSSCSCEDATRTQSCVVVKNRCSHCVLNRVVRCTHRMPFNVRETFSCRESINVRSKCGRRCKKCRDSNLARNQGAGRLFSDSFSDARQNVLRNRFIGALKCSTEKFKSYIQHSQNRYPDHPEASSVIVMSVHKETYLPPDVSPDLLCNENLSSEKRNRSEHCNQTSLELLPPTEPFLQVKSSTAQINLPTISSKRVLDLQIEESLFNTEIVGTDLSVEAERDIFEDSSPSLESLVPDAFKDFHAEPSQPTIVVTEVRSSASSLVSEIDQKPDSLPLFLQESAICLENNLFDENAVNTSEIRGSISMEQLKSATEGKPESRGKTLTTPSHRGSAWAKAPERDISKIRSKSSRYASQVRPKSTGNSQPKSSVARGQIPVIPNKLSFRETLPPSLSRHAECLNPSLSRIAPLSTFPHHSRRSVKERESLGVQAKPRALDMSTSVETVFLADASEPSSYPRTSVSTQWSHDSLFTAPNPIEHAELESNLSAREPIGLKPVRRSFGDTSLPVSRRFEPENRAIFEEDEPRTSSESKPNGEATNVVEENGTLHLIPVISIVQEEEFTSHQSMDTKEDHSSSTQSAPAESQQKYLSRASLVSEKKKDSRKIKRIRGHLSVHQNYPYRPGQASGTVGVTTHRPSALSEHTVKTSKLVRTQPIVNRGGKLASSLLCHPSCDVNRASVDGSEVARRTDRTAPSKDYTKTDQSSLYFCDASCEVHLPERHDVDSMDSVPIESFMGVIQNTTDRGTTVSKIDAGVDSTPAPSNLISTASSALNLLPEHPELASTGTSATNILSENYVVGESGTLRTSTHRGVLRTKSHAAFQFPNISEKKITKSAGTSAIHFDFMHEHDQTVDQIDSEKRPYQEKESLVSTRSHMSLSSDKNVTTEKVVVPVITVNRSREIVPVIIDEREQQKVTERRGSSSVAHYIKAPQEKSQGSIAPPTVSLQPKGNANNEAYAIYEEERKITDAFANNYAPSECLFKSEKEEQPISLLSPTFKPDLPDQVTIDAAHNTFKTRSPSRTRSLTRVKCSTSCGTLILSHVDKDFQISQSDRTLHTPTSQVRSSDHNVKIQKSNETEVSLHEAKQGSQDMEGTKKQMSSSRAAIGPEDSAYVEGSISLLENLHTSSVSATSRRGHSLEDDRIPEKPAARVQLARSSPRKPTSPIKSRLFLPVERSTTGFIISELRVCPQGFSDVLGTLDCHDHGSDASLTAFKSDINPSPDDVISNNPEDPGLLNQDIKVKAKNIVSFISESRSTLFQKQKEDLISETPDTSSVHRIPLTHLPDLGSYSEIGNIPHDIMEKLNLRSHSLPEMRGALKEQNQIADTNVTVSSHKLGKHAPVSESGSFVAQKTADIQTENENVTTDETIAPKKTDSCNSVHLEPLSGSSSSSTSDHEVDRRDDKGLKHHKVVTSGPTDGSEASEDLRSPVSHRRHHHPKATDDSHIENTFYRQVDLKSKKAKRDPCSSIANPTTRTDVKTKSQGAKVFIKDFFRALKTGKWPMRRNVMTSTSDLKCAPRSRSAPPRCATAFSKAELFKKDRHVHCYGNGTSERGRYRTRNSVPSACDSKPPKPTFHRRSKSHSSPHEMERTRRPSQHSVRFDFDGSDTNLSARSGLCNMSTWTDSLQSSDTDVSQTKSLPQLPRRGGLKRTTKADTEKKSRCRSEGRLNQLGTSAVDDEVISSRLSSKTAFERHKRCYEERRIYPPIPLCSSPRTRTADPSSSLFRKSRSKATIKDNEKRTSDVQNKKMEKTAPCLPGGLCKETVSDSIIIEPVSVIEKVEKAVIWTKPGSKDVPSVPSSRAMWLMFPSVVAARSETVSSVNESAHTIEDDTTYENRSKLKVGKVCGDTDLSLSFDDLGNHLHKDSARSVVDLSFPDEDSSKGNVSVDDMKCLKTLKSLLEVNAESRKKSPGAWGSNSRGGETSLSPSWSRDSVAEVVRVTSLPVVTFPSGASSPRHGRNDCKGDIIIQEISNEDVCEVDCPGSSSGVVTSSRLSCLQEETDSDVILDSFNVTEPVTLSRPESEKWQALEKTLGSSHHYTKHCGHGFAPKRKPKKQMDDDEQWNIERSARLRSKSLKGFYRSPSSSGQHKDRDHPLAPADKPDISRLPSVKETVPRDWPVKGSNEYRTPRVHFVEERRVTHSKSSLREDSRHEGPNKGVSDKRSTLRQSTSLTVGLQSPERSASPAAVINSPAKILVSRAKSTVSLTGIHDQPVVQASTSESFSQMFGSSGLDVMVVELFRKQPDDHSSDLKGEFPS